jgi:hypothetical protein
MVPQEFPAACPANNSLQGSIPDATTSISLLVTFKTAVKTLCGAFVTPGKAGSGTVDDAALTVCCKRAFGAT